MKLMNDHEPAAHFFPMTVLALNVESHWSQNTYRLSVEISRDIVG